jgi:hypothetical protein
MTTLVKRTRWVGGAAAALACCGVAIAACSGDDNGVTPQYTYDSGSPQDSTVSDGPVADTSMVLAVCNNYGGYTGVSTFATHIISAVGADCRLSAHFTDQTAVAHINECFQKQLGYFMGCAGITYDGSKDSAGNACRSMADAHNNLNLRQADFDAFIADMIASLSADKVAKPDITSIISVFLGYQAAIVQKNGLGNSDCTCANGSYDGGEAGSCYAPDAGSDSDASDSEAGEGGGEGGDDGSGGEAGQDGAADSGGG